MKSKKDTVKDWKLKKTHQPCRFCGKIIKYRNLNYTDRLEPMNEDGSLHEETCDKKLLKPVVAIPVTKEMEERYLR